ncbi:MAG: riboflavin synthase [Pseudobdellovibrionaceae bacterium]
MFSGIVETTTELLEVQEGQSIYRIFLKRPIQFDDLQIGDSVAVNGVCLTVEMFDSIKMQFSLGLETLQVLQWKQQDWKNRKINVERSLKLSDRIHGHLVTGHVEALGKVLRSDQVGENWFLDVEVPTALLPLIWKKGSITLHGVSLTVNTLEKNILQVCLIPETQKRTNLIEFKKDDFIHLESDYMAKAFYRFYELQGKDEH